MGSKSTKPKQTTTKQLSVGPRTVEQMCEDCEMGKIDYSLWPNRGMEDAAIFVLRKMIDGVSPERIPDSAHDPDSGFDIPTPAIPAGKKCANRIVAGECVNFCTPPELAG